MTLPGRSASLKTYNILIKESQGSSQVLLQDVMFGEVYVCSGQSNMQLGSARLSTRQKEIANSTSHGKGLRILRVELSPAYYNVSVPQENISLSFPWGHPCPVKIHTKRWR